jgi:hypothetical protein
MPRSCKHRTARTGHPAVAESSFEQPGGLRDFGALALRGGLQIVAPEFPQFLRPKIVLAVLLYAGTCE